MRVTRNKALVIAEAACLDYTLGNMPSLIAEPGPSDDTPVGQPRFFYVFRPDGSHVRVFIDGPFAGIPYHSAPASSGTWLGLKR